MELNERHKRFADEYLIDLNATAAYIRAGYKATGGAAESAASRLLGNVKVQSYIQERRKALEARTEVTQERVLQELAKIGFANMTDFLSYRTERTVVGYEDGETVFGYQEIIEMKPSDAVDGAVIAEVKQTREGLAFKLHDKVAALEKIGKHLGMWKDKLEVSGEGGGPIQVVFSNKMKPKEPPPE